MKALHAEEQFTFSTTDTPLFIVRSTYFVPATAIVPSTPHASRLTPTSREQRHHALKPRRLQMQADRPLPRIEQQGGVSHRNGLHGDVGRERGHLRSTQTRHSTFTSALSTTDSPLIVTTPSRVSMCESARVVFWIITEAVAERKSRMCVASLRLRAETVSHSRSEFRYNMPSLNRRNTLWCPKTQCASVTSHYS